MERKRISIQHQNSSSEFPIEIILRAVIVFVDVVKQIEEIEEPLTGWFNRLRGLKIKRRKAEMESIKVVKYFYDGVDFYGLTELLITPHIKLTGYYNQSRGWYLLPDGETFNVEGGIEELHELLKEKKMI